MYIVKNRGLNFGVKSHTSYFQTYAERQLLTQKSQTAFFLSIVMTQVANVIICKTRRVSLFQKGFRYRTCFSLNCYFYLTRLFLLFALGITELILNLHFKYVFFLETGEWISPYLGNCYSPHSSSTLQFLITSSISIQLGKFCNEQ